MKVIFSTDLSSKRKKKLLESLLTKIWKCLIWANLESFSPISRNQQFFSKVQLCDSSTFISSSLMQKIRKILIAVSEKTALLTNQTSITDFGLIWRPFRKYLQIKYFFQKSTMWLFYLYSPLTPSKKSEKYVELFLTKQRY